MSALHEFLRGFADSCGIDHQAADAQWAGFSRDLTDAERQRTEAGGYAMGVAEGEVYVAMYGR